MEYTKARHEQMIEGRTAAQIAPTPTPAQPMPRQMPQRPQMPSNLEEVKTEIVPSIQAAGLPVPTRAEAFMPGYAIYYGERAMDVLSPEEYKGYVDNVNTLAAFKPRTEEEVQRTYR